MDYSVPFKNARFLSGLDTVNHEMKKDGNRIPEQSRRSGNISFFTVCRNHVMGLGLC